MPPIRLKMQIILHNQSALKHFIAKFCMRLGVSTDLLTAEFAETCRKFQCVRPTRKKSLWSESFFKILREREFKFMRGAFSLTKLF